MNLQIPSHFCHAANCFAEYFSLLYDFHLDDHMLSSTLPGKCNASEICFSVDVCMDFPEMYSALCQVSTMVFFIFFLVTLFRVGFYW